MFVITEGGGSTEGKCSMHAGHAVRFEHQDLLLILADSNTEITCGECSKHRDYLRGVF